MACFISSADELGDRDRADRVFVAGDVFVEREQKPLGMFGSQHDPALEPGLGQAGHDPHEVEHEFRGRVRDDDMLAYWPSAISSPSSMSIPLESSFFTICRIPYCDFR